MLSHYLEHIIVYYSVGFMETALKLLQYKKREGC